MRELIPRPAQKQIIDFIVNHPRCNIFASPGTGKTSATLAALDTLSVLGEPAFPALVVAPPRVANLVWAEEILQWSRFQGLTAVRVLGTPKQRKAALQTKADVYTIHYGLLCWLREALEDRWPFTTVVCDESTPLKGHRVRYRTSAKGKRSMVVPKNKSKNACALVRFAPETRRWINLTATPVSNGLLGAWGIHWPLDFGKALGENFSRYTDRWFRIKPRTDPMHQRFEPMPGAEDSILEAMQPLTLSLEAKDWMDIDEPITLDYKVAMPEKAKGLYKAVRNETAEQLADAPANAGAILMKLRQVAAGMLHDGEGHWEDVHFEKLEALQEIKDKADGPLLVAYYFQRDADHIRKKFPKAVALPKGTAQAEVTRDWNDGKIPLLMFQAGSAAHGLNLQHGGNHLCIYTIDWDLEVYQQVIERLGPTRQKQSGYDRPVYIHRIITQDTVDEMIAKRLRSKRSVHDMAMEYLKEFEK